MSQSTTLSVNRHRALVLGGFLSVALLRSLVRR